MNKFLERIPDDVKSLAKLFREDGYSIYLVGGCVRDLLMGREPHDWDMCTDATPLQMKYICRKANMFHTRVGEEHGTITFYPNDVGYEITTFRIDGDYSDGRHPDEVQFTTSLEADLARRDLTINAMALDPETGELIDPHGGAQDICRMRIAAVGSAEKRIEEDALRMPRAIRFAIAYGFMIDADLVIAIRNHVKDIEKVSKERVTEEFRKIFATGKPVGPYFNMFSDLITTVIPELKPCVDFNQNNKYHKHNVYEHLLAVVDLCQSNKFEIKMAALLHDIGKPAMYEEDEAGQGHFYGHPVKSAEICKPLLAQRFRLTREETSRILELVEFHDKDIAPTVKSVRRALCKHGEDFMNDWFILKQADMDDHIYPDDKYPQTVAPLIPIMMQILDDNMAFSLKDLHITGNLIMSTLGLKQGKIIGVILNRLLEEVIDEKLENTGAALITRAEEILKEENGND